MSAHRRALLVTTKDAQRAVHEAVGLFLGENEIAVCWTITIEVAGQDDVRYLAHRAGGGVDGTDAPMCWTALGMLEASRDLALEQLRDSTYEDGESE